MLVIAAGLGAFLGGVRLLVALIYDAPQSQSPLLVAALLAGGLGLLVIGWRMQRS